MVRVEQLGFGYTPKRSILDKVNFSVRRGEVLGILGKNGAGKSTMLKCLNKILPLSCGSVVLNGEELSTMSRHGISQRIAFVAQSNERQRMTVYETILLGRIPFMKWGVTPEDEAIIEDVIQLLDLQDYTSRYMDELSGGEAQKIYLARALAQQPQLLLLDEPTSNLDIKNQYATMALVRHIVQERNISAIVVLHDLNLALRYCDRYLLLNDGGVHTIGGDEVITEKVIEDVYGMPVCLGEIEGKKVVIPQ